MHYKLSDVETIARKIRESKIPGPEMEALCRHALTDVYDIRREFNLNVWQASEEETASSDRLKRPLYDFLLHAHETLVNHQTQLTQMRYMIDFMEGARIWRTAGACTPLYNQAQNRSTLEMLKDYLLRIYEMSVQQGLKTDEQFLQTVLRQSNLANATALTRVTPSRKYFRAGVSALKLRRIVSGVSSRTYSQVHQDSIDTLFVEFFSDFTDFSDSFHRAFSAVTGPTNVQE